MTDATMQFSRDDLTETLSGYLRQRSTNAKDLARRVNCDPRAAEEYRSGRKLPPLPVFIRIVRELGRDIGEALIDPETTAARLEQELHEHERRAEETRAALRAVAGAAPRRSEVAQVDRTAAAVASDPGRGGGA